MSVVEWSADGCSARHCGVDVKFTKTGQPHSATVRVELITPHTTYRPTIAFTIEDGVARISGMIELSELGMNELRLVPLACEQLRRIPSIETVEPPATTVCRYFEQGQAIRSDNTTTSTGCSKVRERDHQ